VSYQESKIIKKPYQKTFFTTNQMHEFAKCANHDTGHKYFLSHYFWVQCNGKVQYAPYPFQEALIDTYHNNRWSICLLPRQSGKTVTAAGYLLWYAMFHSNVTILIAAHKFLGASEIMKRIKFGYESCPDYIRAGISEYNKQSIIFDNGSTITAQTTTESTGRGLSIDILYCDELAFVKRQQMAREMWTSCSLTLAATGGKAIITSTPNNSDDLFSEIWRGANTTIDENGFTIPGGVGINGFKAFRSYWQEHPDRDEAWAVMWRKKIGEARFLREIECRFVTYEETLINSLKLCSMAGIEPKINMGQIRWYNTPSKDKTYLVALDPSLGTGGDSSAIEILECSTMSLIGEWCDNKTPIERQVAMLKEITTYLSEITTAANVYYSVENNTIGEAILVTIRAVGEENIPGIFLSEPVKLGSIKKFRKGFNTTNSVKLAACAKLKHLIESDILKIYSKKLINELKHFISVENTYKAKTGETDDLVMGTILIIRMLSTLENYLPELYDKKENTDKDIPLPFLVDCYW
jgi:hypothetical protein